MTAIDWEARWAFGGWAEDAELRRKRFPIGPRNCYSNVAYLLAALYLVLTGEGTTRWVVAGGMALLAIGSAGYHAFKTKKWNNADWFGMASVMAPLTVNGVLHSSQGLPLGALSVGLVAASLIAGGKHSDVVMGALFVGASVPPFLAGNIWPVVEAVVLFALAMAFWRADKKRWAIVGLYGHAAWHCLTGFAMPQLYQAQG